MRKFIISMVSGLFTVVALAFVPSCSPRAATDSATTAAATQAAAPVESCTLGSTQPIHEVGGLYLAGQPKADDFERAKDQGIKTVINLRHDKEITDFDEEQVVEAAGLSYVHLPWNGTDELTDQVFDRTRELLKTAERPILLHCGSSNRVGAVWLPWRVLDDGVDLETAVEEAKTIGLKKAEYEEKGRDYISRNRQPD